MTRSLTHLAAALAGLAPAAFALAQVNQLPRQNVGVEVKERLGEKADLSVMLTDSDGKQAPLSSRFTSGKPVILVMGYYDCPLVCPLVLDKLLLRLNGIDYTIGQDYNVVYVSFDPDNTTAMAADYAQRYRADYKPGTSTPTVKDGFTFTTTTDENARALAASIGERYNYLPESDEYSHPVVFTVLAPDGTITRYMYGFAFTAQDMKLALMEATDGKIARGVTDRFLYYCFHYDPTTGTYSVAAVRVMQIGGLACATGLAALISSLWFFDHRRRTRRGGVAHSAHAELSGTALTGHTA